MNYAIADFMIRIKNASMAGRRDVVLPYSSVNKTIGEVLVSQKFLADIREAMVEKRRVLIATIVYVRRKAALRDVTIVSKPSLRVYRKAKGVQNLRRKGAALFVLSTPKGIMTDKEAQKLGIGGELLFAVW